MMLCNDLIDRLTRDVNCHTKLEGTIMIASDDGKQKYLTSSFDGAAHYKILEMLEKFANQELVSAILRCTWKPVMPKDEMQKKQLENQEKLYGPFPPVQVDTIIICDASGMTTTDNLIR